MTFEIWVSSSGKSVRKVGATSSWALANFYARFVSLAGESMIIGDAVFDGEAPGNKTLVATYRLGRVERFFAGAPGKPSIWP